jgi:hypothetical protein
MRAGADGGGTVARAGAGIDLGVGGILVDVDLGRRRTGLGAVVETGWCGGWGGGRRCLRRRGARGSGRSIKEETRRRRSVRMTETSGNLQQYRQTLQMSLENIVTQCHFQSFTSTLEPAFVIRTVPCKPTYLPTYHLNVSTRSKSTLFSNNSSTVPNVSPKSHRPNTVINIPTHGEAAQTPILITYRHNEPLVHVSSLHDYCMILISSVSLS